MLDEKIEIKALQMGIVDFITKPFSTPVLLNRIRLHLDMSGVIRERTIELNRAKQDIIFVLADVVENRDESTGDHLGRTSRLVKLLLETMRQQNIYLDLIKDWDDYLIAECSLMHDVGKISTPDAILRKPGKLTAKEFEIMKHHTVAGERLLNKVIERSGENVFLRHSKIFAISHHERWNGTGYPYNLKGDAIPLQGRIMAIVDVYDALISERIYKKAFTEDETLALILEEKGKHFDPLLVDVLFSIKDRVREEIYLNGQSSLNYLVDL
jgi:putative two-component system response regulator